MFDPTFDANESECRRLLRSSADKSRQRSLRVLRAQRDLAEGALREDLALASSVLQGEAEAVSLQRHTSPLFRGWMAHVTRSAPGSQALQTALGWTNNMCLSFSRGVERPLATFRDTVPTWMPDRCFVVSFRPVLAQGDSAGPPSGASPLRLERRTGARLRGRRIWVDDRNPLLQIEPRAGEAPGGSLGYQKDTPREERSLAAHMAPLEEAFEHLGHAGQAYALQAETLLRVIVPGFSTERRELQVGCTLESHPGAVWLGPSHAVQTLEALIRVSAATRLRYLEECSPLVHFLSEADGENDFFTPLELGRKEHLVLHQISQTYAKLSAAKVLLERVYLSNPSPKEEGELHFRGRELLREGDEGTKWLINQNVWNATGRRFLDWCRHTFVELDALADDREEPPSGVGERRDRVSSVPPFALLRRKGEQKLRCAPSDPLAV